PPTPKFAGRLRPSDQADVVICCLWPSPGRACGVNRFVHATARYGTRSVTAHTAGPSSHYRLRGVHASFQIQQQIHQFLFNCLPNLSTLQTAIDSQYKERCRGCICAAAANNVMLLICAKSIPFLVPPDVSQYEFQSGTDHRGAHHVRLYTVQRGSVAAANFVDPVPYVAELRDWNPRQSGALEPI
ncbi:unnamed protein product, partial [Mycena citricolor]